MRHAAPAGEQPAVASHAAGSVPASPEGPAGGGTPRGAPALRTLADFAAWLLLDGNWAGAHGRAPPLPGAGPHPRAAAGYLAADLPGLAEAARVLQASLLLICARWRLEQSGF